MKLATTLAALHLLGLLALLAGHKPSAAAGDTAQKHALVYKFTAGESIRWNVEHRARIRTTVSGTTQTAEMETDSTKVWKVTGVTPAGEITFVHSVESVRMRSQVSGREPQTYNSQTDKEPPLGFEETAKKVGVPLVTITMDNRGNILNREDKVSQADENDGPLTIPLPKDPIAVGEVWKFDHVIRVPRRDKSFKVVKSQQRFKLESVQDGVATISVETVILTPIHDPQIEAQLVQRELHGRIKFLIAQGRIVEQSLELDKNVVGAPSGENSSMHYVMRFVEKLDPGTAKTAQGPVAGPPVK
jgi:hypothetical protein